VASRVVVRAAGATCVAGAGVDGAGSDGADVDGAGAVGTVTVGAETVGAGGWTVRGCELLAGGPSGWGAATVGAGSGLGPAATATGAIVKPNATAHIQTRPLHLTPSIEIPLFLLPFGRP
jgi:hypothetical protein